MSDWRALFPDLASAHRYLNTLPDQAARARVAHDLRLPAAGSPDEAIQPPPVPTPAATVTLHLPWPPSVNAVWRAVVVRSRPRVAGGLPYRARILLSRRGRAYRTAVMRQVREQGSPALPPGMRLALTLEAFPPDRRRRDVSNLPKAVEDALTHAGVWADDSLIDELHLHRRACRPGGLVVATIGPLGAQV